MDVADGALGNVIERLTISHHRRRLRRVGWSAAIDPGPGIWASGNPPPRDGNAFDVMIDGANALQAMALAVAEARSSVHLTGWHLTHDVADNFAMRWQAVTGESLPPVAPPPPVGEIELQVVRTVPDGMYRPLPRGDFRVLESYLRALRAAQRFIYLENQFLWSPEILAVLRDKLARPPTPDFRMVLLLPAKPDKGGDDTRGQLGTLVQADGDKGRLLACTLYAVDGEKDWPVYLHAKVGIVDDAWMTIGSANLNEHSLFNDTEMNLVTRDPRLALQTRLHLWAEHQQRPVTELHHEPAAGRYPRGEH